MDLSESLPPLCNRRTEATTLATVRTWLLSIQREQLGNLAGEETTLGWLGTRGYAYNEGAKCFILAPGAMSADAREG